MKKYRIQLAWLLLMCVAFPLHGKLNHYSAAYQGNLAALKKIIPKIKEQEKIQYALVGAAEGNNIEALEYIYDFFTDKAVKHNALQLALIRTMRHSRFKVSIEDKIKTMGWLLKHGASVNKFSKERVETPLIMAIKSNSLRLVTFFLDRNADIHKREKLYNRTPLIMACDSAHNIDVLKLLIKKGADINARDKFKQSAFIRAVYKKRFDLARELIKRDVDVSGYTVLYANGYRSTPLHKAAKWLAVDIVEHLIQKGVNLEVKNDEKHTVVLMLRILCYQVREMEAYARRGKIKLNPERKREEKIYKKIISILLKAGAKDYKYNKRYNYGK